MSREILDQWCERGILALVLAILVFGPLATGAVRTLDFLVIQGLALGVMLLWAARLWLDPRPQLLWPPICWAVLAFALFAIVAYLRADIEYVARQELIHVLIYAILFVAILNNLHRQEFMQVITFGLLFLAMLISFCALYQFLTRTNKVPTAGGLLEWLIFRDKSWLVTSPYEHRAVGTYINPNNLGGFLEMLLPLGLAYTLASRLKPLTKVFVGYAALIILAGIAVTVSRGSWISTALALVVFFGLLVWNRAYRLPALVLLAALVVAGFVLLPRTEYFKERVHQLFEGGKINDDKRFDLWLPALRLWRENVWWGAGPGHFDARFRAYRPQDIQMQPRWVHNDYLNTLTDWGLPGAALVGAAWVLLGAGVIKTWRVVRGPTAQLGEQRRSNKFAFVLGASLGLLAILLHSLVDFNLHIPANTILAVALIALLSSHLRFATERYWVRARLWLKLCASAVLLGGVLYLGRQELRHAAEYAWLERAARAPHFFPAQIERLKMAFRAEPLNAVTGYSIGEAFRIESQEGTEDYRQLAAQAMEWFARAQKLDPWDERSFLGYGWCLDWVGRKTESAPYFDRAEQLDPNGYFTIATIGLHYIEIGNFAAAKPWLERSLRLQRQDNPIAQDYLQIIATRLMERATNHTGTEIHAP
ncbi:MAG: hypothetical protein DME25_00365 [Verrucomicrobia bacterium]|nr:MAG: hypothetical protein DME25_00365 [Verrucomicrobiota bacterium]